MRPELTLLYVHGTAIGYGRMGVKLAEALVRAGVDVYDHQDAPDEVALSSADRMVVEGRRAKDTNVACWLSVPTHARGWKTGQIPVIFSMWEATNLPESFRETLHHFDTVIVPSDQNVELFSRYHPNVKRVLLGVDGAEWKYVPRQPPGMFFNFLIGGSGPRKGTDLAYKAFHKVFPSTNKDGSRPWWQRGDKPVPRLIFKNPKGEDFHGDRVEVISGRISDQDEIDLYAQAHCYLQPSRGEGFGLQPLQAIAQGCPTILTDAHGHAAFSHLGVPIGSSLVPAAYFIYGDAGEWWEPNFDELCAAMEDVYLRYDHYTECAKDSAAKVARDLTWDNSASQFIDAIGEDRLTTPYTGNHDWFTPQAKRFLVRVNSEWQADIAGVTYHFKPGRDYWELADVKRILFEAGKLDPECLRTFMRSDDTTYDLGLTEEQLKKLGDYTAIHSHCPTCGQRLNSSPTRADEIFAELQAKAGQ